MYKKSRKLLAWGLVVCMILTNILFTNAFAFERVSGSDRYETAAEIALEAYEDGTDTAVLATGLVGADALAAAPLAAQLDAPILLTAKNELPDATVEALEDLGVENVVVVGGKGAVSEDVVEELEDLGYDVERIAGADRFETSLLIAEELDDADAAFLVNGIKTADALSVSSIAAALGMPILLTAANNVSEDIVEFLADMDVYVVGGKAAVSDDVLDEVDGERIAVSGGDRFDTNVAVIEAFEDDLDFDVVYVASALDAKFADALAGGPLAAKTNSAVLLVGASLADATADFVEEYLDADVTFVALGGKASVSNDVLEDLEALFEVDGILKVEAVASLITDDDDFTLKFKVNGKEWDTNKLAHEGYDIEFVADEEIFSKDLKDDNAKISTSGELTEDDLSTFLGGEEEATFEYKVVIFDGNKVVAESEYVEVMVVDDEATAVSSISDVTISVAGESGYEIEELASNKLVLGETATVEEIVGTAHDGRYEIVLTNFTVKTSNPAVLSVNDNVLTTEKPGTAKVTITSGNVEKEISLTVTTEARKLTSAEVDKSSFKLGLDVEESFTVTLRDQFKDTFDAEVDDTVAGDYELIAVTADKGLLADTYPQVVAGDGADGEVEVTFVTANSPKTGYIYVKDGNKILVKVSVTVAGGAAETTKLEAVDGSVIDLNALADKDEIEFTLNSYTKSGVYLGYDKALTDYTIELVDADGDVIIPDLVHVNGVITVTRDMLLQEDEVDLTGIENTLVDNFEIGTAQVKVVDTDTAVAYTAKFSVVNTQPKLTNVKFENGFDFIAGKNDDGEVSLDDILSFNFGSVAGDKVVRFGVAGADSDILYAYVDCDGDSAVDEFDYTEDLFLGVIEVTPVDKGEVTTPGITFDVDGNFTASDVTLTVVGGDGDEFLFNFYAPGDINTYEKPLATATMYFNE